VAQTPIGLTPFMSTFPQAVGYSSKISGHEAAQSKLLLQLGTNPRQTAQEAAQ